MKDTCELDDLALISFVYLRSFIPKLLKQFVKHTDLDDRALISFVYLVPSLLCSKLVQIGQVRRSQRRCLEGQG